MNTPLNEQSKFLNCNFLDIINTKNISAQQFFKYTNVFSMKCGKTGSFSPLAIQLEPLGNRWSLQKQVIHVVQFPRKAEIVYHPPWGRGEKILESPEIVQLSVLYKLWSNYDLLETEWWPIHVTTVFSQLAKSYKYDKNHLKMY